MPQEIAHLSNTGWKVSFYIFFVSILYRHKIEDNNLKVSNSILNIFEIPKFYDPKK